MGERTGGRVCNFDRVIYFDVETTGLDPVQQDIIQLAGVIKINGQVYEKFNLKCQPFSYENVQLGALQTNKTTIEKIRTYPSPQVTCNALCDILDKYVFLAEEKFTLVGQNIAFDIGFLKQFFVKNGKELLYGKYFTHKSIDLLSITAFLSMFHKLPKTPRDSFKLTTVAKSLGINTDGAHDAMVDVQLVIDVLEQYGKLLK